MHRKSKEKVGKDCKKEDIRQEKSEKEIQRQINRDEDRKSKRKRGKGGRKERDNYLNYLSYEREAGNQETGEEKVQKCVCWVELCYSQL
jgi:hypothetical protein